MLCVLEQRMTHHLIFKEHCWAFDGFHPFHLWSRVKPSTPPDVDQRGRPPPPRHLPHLHHQAP